MIDPADYSREFTDHCAEQIEMSELSPTTGDWCAHCGVGFILPSGLCDHCNANPCAKVLDHKWLDPVCVEGGCQSLLIKQLIEALEACMSCLPCLQVHNWPPGWELKRRAIELSRSALMAVDSMQDK